MLAIGRVYSFEYTLPDKKRKGGQLMGFMDLFKDDAGLRKEIDRLRKENRELERRARKAEKRGRDMSLVLREVWKNLYGMKGLINLSDWKCGGLFRESVLKSGVNEGLVPDMNLQMKEEWWLREIISGLASYVEKHI